MTTTDIIREVALAFSVTEAEILSDKRTEWVAHARHAAMWFCRDCKGMNQRAISSAFRRNGHHGVSYGLSRVPDYLAHDDHFVEAFARASGKLSPVAAKHKIKVAALRANLKELLA